MTGLCRRANDQMLCKIAELLVEVPEVGDMIHRCQAYCCEERRDPDIVISQEEYRYERYLEISKDSVIYMESGSQFCFHLLNYNGLYLHASAVALDGKAYLFSAPCGTGKSTHTRIWQQTFGSAAKVFNDDKPVLRYLNGIWYAYGTPWCGKDGININMKVPVAGICFLKKSKENKIRRLTKSEALQNILSQTFHQFKKVENLDKMLTLVESLLDKIPVFELENRPEPDAAMLSYETLRVAAEEAGL